MKFAGHERGVTTDSLDMAFFFLQLQAEQSDLVRPFTMLAWPLVTSTRNREKCYSLGSSAILIFDLKSAWAVIQEILARCLGWCSLWSSSAEGSGLDAVLMKWLCCVGELLPLRLTLGTEKNCTESGLWSVKCRIRNDRAKEEQEKKQVVSFSQLPHPFPLENPSSTTYLLEIP